MLSFDMVALLSPVFGHGRKLGEVFGWETNSFTREEETMIAEYLLLFILLLVMALILQFYIGKVWHLHYLPESGGTILIGMTISLCVYLSGKDTTPKEEGTGMLGFNSTVFFIAFLPPIIYNSGYQLKRRLFFANLGGIVSLAIIGTTFSAFFVGSFLFAFGQMGISSPVSYMEGLCFGSLISATDPVSTLAIFVEKKVDPTLFYLVFGESVLNDAIGITLFRTTGKFVGKEMEAAEGFIAIIDFCISFAGSSIIGYAMGVASAWLFRRIDLSAHRLTLVGVFIGLIYVPFLLSETLQLSGIVTMFFSAITARRYIAKNVSPEAKRATSFVFELLAYMAETSVFLFLGLSVFSKELKEFYKADFIIWTLILCVVGRALHVYPLLNMVNNYRTKRAVLKNRRAILIPQNTKHMVFLSGLRGAVAYACANVFPGDNKNLIVATTMVVVLVTIFVNGGLTSKLLEVLSIEVNVDPEPYIAKLKKQAKPYSFLKWEHKYIYPLIVNSDDTNLSEDGDDHHLGHSVHDVEEGQGGDDVHAEGKATLELSQVQVDDTNGHSPVMRNSDLDDEDENPYTNTDENPYVYSDKVKLNSKSSSSSTDVVQSPLYYNTQNQGGF